MFNRLLDHLEEWLVASFMALATIIIFVAVLHRYTASIPWVWQFTQHLSLTWAQELCIYLFIWMAKFGAAYGVRTGIHVVEIGRLLARCRGGGRTGCSRLSRRLGGVDGAQGREKEEDQSRERGFHIKERVLAWSVHR